MHFEVVLTEDAERDLEEIIDYIAQRDDPAKASHVLDRLEQVLDKLATHPGRGSFPKELLALGIRDYRQTFFKPYRLIYRVLGNQVCVYLVADGRRDMQTLLTRRLLGA
jgi:toxin ParE1/3/4